ncbi:deoxyribonuclease gamma-like isoform X2 [Mugil cephalus]|uniref:deoxyribonuclease gamma-like isoform X2 n=1 Tax=Mugil cephalus TaxID=48193 RepID=UPI001FB5FCD8|nr:deoxyribonuclease gamma-like isoform X2 [Mugil cephalus]
MRWRSSSHLPLLLLLLFIGSVSGLRICSYNVQKFNQKKSTNYRVMHTLTRIVSRCDICLLQDVVDSGGKAVKALLNFLNRYDEHAYKAVSSKSLGTSPSDMQQYVFIYKSGMVSVTGEYQYQKPQSFVRPPFAVYFNSQKTTEINDFILVPLHSEPSQAVQEIDRLYDVFEEVSKKWNNQNVMFLGDFHAGCAYVTRNDRKNIRLYTNSSFSWLIGDRVDTTVTDNTHCPYDRIVVHGQSFLKAIRPFSGKVYNFGKDLKLSRSKVVEVSDHYPVEVRLKGSGLLLQAPPLLMLLGVSVIVQSFLSSLGSSG